jgi:hypothetical protein
MLEFKGKCVIGIDLASQAEIQVNEHCQKARRRKPFPLDSEILENIMKHNKGFPPKRPL